MSIGLMLAVLVAGVLTWKLGVSKRPEPLVPGGGDGVAFREEFGSQADESAPSPMSILANAEQFELLSIEPVMPAQKSTNDFHGWKVLGKTAVQDSSIRLHLVTAFQKGIADYDGAIALCFNPRHGIRAIHNGRTADFAICFECLEVHTFVDDQFGPGIRIARTPQPVFDSVLRAANIPLAEKSKKD